MLLLMPALIRGYPAGMSFGKVVLSQDIQMSETNWRPSCLPLPLSSWELDVPEGALFSDLITSAASVPVSHFEPDDLWCVQVFVLLT